MRRIELKWPGPRTRRRIAITLASIVATWAILIGLVAPPIARSVAEKKLTAALHRRTTIAKIVVNPFTLALTVRGFAVRDRDGGPFVAFDEALTSTCSSCRFCVAAPSSAR